MAVLEWTVLDIPETKLHFHQSEWKTSFRGVDAVILRNNSRFTVQIERAGIQVRGRITRSTLMDAKLTAQEEILLYLSKNAPGMTYEEASVREMSILRDLAKVYRDNAARAAEAGSYAEELPLLLQAEEYDGRVAEFEHWQAQRFQPVTP